LAERTPSSCTALRFLPAGLLLLADQWSKWEALRALEPYQSVALWPGVNLTLAFNPGAAFSFLADAGGWQRWLFSLLAAVVIIWLVVWLCRTAKDRWLERAALSLVLAGAAGNLLDRLRLGHVVDFIDLYYRHWHWPAFNLADSWLTVGAVLLFSILWREEKP